MPEGFSIPLNAKYRYVVTRLERKGKSLELSGSVPFSSLAMPLTSAQDHYREIWSGAYGLPHIALCVGVIDAAIVVARGTPETPQLTVEPWVRVVRQESAEGRGAQGWICQHYVIDFIHRGFVSAFVENHAIPFANTVAGRILQKPDVISGGKGTVEDLDNFTWNDVT